MVVEQDQQDITGQARLPDLAALSQDRQPEAAPGAVILDVRNVSIRYGSFKAVTEGKYDNLPEQAFYMVGGIEDVERKAKELERS